MPPLESRLSTHKWPQLYGAIFFQQGFEGFFMETMDEVVGSAKINIFMSYVKVLTRNARSTQNFRTHRDCGTHWDHIQRCADSALVKW